MNTPKNNAIITDNTTTNALQMTPSFIRALKVVENSDLMVKLIDKWYVNR